MNQGMEDECHQGMEEDECINARCPAERAIGRIGGP